MRNLFVLSFLVIIITQSYSQNCDWMVYDHEDSSSSFIAGICSNNANDIFLGGYYYGSLSLGTSQVIANGTYINSYVAKIDSLGNVVWLKSFGDNSHKCFCKTIACDNSGNVYIAGTYMYNLTIDTCFLTTNFNMEDVFIIKLNNNGDMVWVKDIKSVATLDTYDLRISNTGIYIHIKATNYNNVYFDTITKNGNTIIAKYNFDGQILWVNGFDYLINSRMTIGENDDVYVSGKFLSDTLNILDTTIINETYYTYYTSPYDSTIVDSTITNKSNILFFSFDSTLVRKWIHKFTGKSNMSWIGEIFYNNTNIFICDQLSDTTYYDNNLLPNYSGTVYTITAKYNSDGDMVSMYNMSPYTIGGFEDMIFDGTNLYYTGQSTSGDIYLLKYNTLNQSFSSFVTNGPNSDYGIVLHSYNGHILLGGIYIYSADFDNCSLSSSFHQFKIFLVKLNNDLTNQIILEQSNELIIFPNPTAGKISIKANFIEDIKIMNIEGKEIYNSKESEVDLSNQPKGIYILKVTTTNGVGVSKVVVE